MKSILSLGILLGTLTLNSCGGGGTSNHGLLQSISISPVSPTSSAQFVATGTFSDGTKVSPLPVSWFIVLFPQDIDPAPGYSLSLAPYTQQCSAGMAGQSFLVTAFAPQDPKAATSGGMTASVWFDFVTAAITSEGGFVGNSAHLNCP